jgi:hypothetical protein
MLSDDKVSELKTESDMFTKSTKDSDFYEKFSNTENNWSYSTVLVSFKTYKCVTIVLIPFDILGPPGIYYKLKLKNTSSVLLPFLTFRTS